jgi:uncharacterized protein YndB with AHSA1/START domain
MTGAESEVGSSDDCIEKQIILRAPIARVWEAISDASQFGAWFGVEFESAFVVGAQAVGRLVPTTVDAEVAKYQQEHEGAAFNITIDRIEPMRLFSFKWHPFGVEPGVNYAAEPMTLIVFALQEVPDGTMLTITESGFTRIPLERRLKAFAANDRGWATQIGLIQRYLDQRV